MPKVPKIRSSHIFAISLEKLGGWCFFCRQINIKVLYKLLVPLWVCLTSNAQVPKTPSLHFLTISLGKREVWTSKASTNWYYQFRCMWPGMPKLPQITSLIFLCNILIRKWVMKLIFLHADKYESYGQIDTIILMEMVKHPQSTQTGLQYVSNISKKKLEMKLIFCMQVRIKVSYKLILTLWTSQFPTRWYCNYWNIFTISPKKLVIESTFLFSFYKLALLFCMEVARHVESTQKRKLVIFLQRLKKKVCNSFCAVLWCKTFWYFILSRVIFVPTCLVLKLLVVASIVF